MPQLSPGVGRVASILKFLADHPDQAFTVSDLVRALKISRATCHTILTSLVQEGFLFRAHDKTYVLGPTLAAIGQVAARHASPLQVAQPEMRALADEFDAVCLAFFRDGYEVFLRARATSTQHLGWPDPKGIRTMLRPPFGGVFFAWSSVAEVQAWFNGVAPPASDENKALALASMNFVREHGFSFVIRNDRYSAFQWVADKMFTEDRKHYPVSQMTSLEPDGEYPMVHMLAPVFAAPGRVAFALGLMGFEQVFSGRQVASMGQRLRDACDRIGSYIGGR